MTRKAKPGRPEGSQNRKYDVVDATRSTVVETRCQACGSTDRTEYQGNPQMLRQEFSDAVVLTVWKRCMCRKCGQWRKDKFVLTERI